MNKKTLFLILLLFAAGSFALHFLYNEFKRELRMRDYLYEIKEEEDLRLKSELDSMQNVVEEINAKINETPPEMTDIFENLKHSVYKIKVYKILEDIDDEEAALMAGVHKTKDGQYYRMSAGTAFCLYDLGLFLTNYHVYDPEADMAIIEDYEGNKYKVDKVVSFNPKLDYTFFACKVENIRPVEILENNPKIGEKAYTIGNPRGFNYTPSEGHIAGFRQGGAVLQVSMPVTFGNSGGPVINSNGQVCGMIYAGMGDANLNFAININHILMDLLNQIETGIFSEEYLSYYESLPDLPAYLENLALVDLANRLK